MFSLDHRYSPPAQRLEGQGSHSIGKPFQQPAPGDLGDPGLALVIPHQPPQIGGHLQSGGASTEDDETELSFFQPWNDPSPGLEEIENRFYRDDIFPGNRNNRFQGNIAPRIKGYHIVIDLIPRLEKQCFLARVDPDHSILDKTPPPVFGHFLPMEADFLGPIDPRKHPRPHARIIMVGRGPNQSNPMPALDEVGKV